MLVEEYAEKKNAIMEKFRRSEICEEQAKDEINKLCLEAGVSVQTNNRVIAKLLDLK